MIPFNGASPSARKERKPPTLRTAGTRTLPAPPPCPPPGRRCEPYRSGTAKPPSPSASGGRPARPATPRPMVRLSRTFRGPKRPPAGIRRQQRAQTRSAMSAARPVRQWDIRRRRTAPGYGRAALPTGRGAARPCTRSAIGPPPLDSGHQPHSDPAFRKSRPGLAGRLMFNRLLIDYPLFHILFGLLDDLERDVGRRVLIPFQRHREGSPGLGHGAKVGGVLEHFGLGTSASTPACRRVWGSCP